MADSDGPVCTNCKVTSSLMWQRNKNGAILCLECHNAEKTSKSTASSETSSHTSSSSSTERTPHSNSPPRVASPNVTTRRATRSRERNTRAKQNQSANTTTKGNEKQATTKSVDSHVKGGNTSQDSTVHTLSSTAAKDRNYPYQLQRGRRSILKQQQQPMKSPLAQPVVITSESVTHKGTRYEVGDIVSILDRDGGVYFAIIRGFLLDEYAEKHAVLTWLLPRYPNPTHFDPGMFVLGPEEDTPRSIDYLNFVSHSPQSRHFQASYFHDLEQAELWSQT